jgi:YXWGXW repeat-containing protein
MHSMGTRSALLLCALPVAGCIVHASSPWVAYTAPEPVIVAEPPPPARVEVPTPQPTADGVWIEGHWEWRAGRYLWVEGRWERTRHGYAWVAPRYEHSGNDWTYVRGHWRPATQMAAPRGPVQHAIPAPPARAAQPQRPPGTY